MRSDEPTASGKAAPVGAASGEAAPEAPEVAITTAAVEAAGSDASDATAAGGEAPRPPGTRTGRVLGAVQVGYIYQAIVLVAGLWLTPFLVERLGATDYGLWLAGAQILAWMYVMDLGVVALVPRETAYAIGRASDDPAASVPRLVDRTAMLLLWQLPFVAVATAGVWLFLPEEYARLTGPLALVFGAFILGFPLRILQALLQGLQDLVYVGVQTLIGWTVGFVLTVVLVLEGYGLYALAIGFVAVQAYQYAASGWRVRTRYRAILPTRLTAIGWAEARRSLTSGAWVSISQIAQVLLAGTDVLIILQVLGPEAVVPYAVTAKLVSTLANQPAAVMQAALPAISEIRANMDMERLQRGALAVTQAMLIASALVFCVVLTVNESFVEWWGIPENPYAGDLLTALLLVAMVARHGNFAIVYTLFALGGERRISLTTLTDGLVTVIVSAVLVREIGIIGVPIGSFIGVMLISVPANLRGLSQRAGVPVTHWLRPLTGWAWRFVVVAIAAAAATTVRVPPTFPGLVVTTLVVGAVVALVMSPVALRPPLGTYLVPRFSRRRRT